MYILKFILCVALAIISIFEAADEIMAKVQHQSREVKMGFKTRNSSYKKVTGLRISVDTAWPRYASL